MHFITLQKRKSFFRKVCFWCLCLLTVLCFQQCTDAKGNHQASNTERPVIDEDLSWAEKMAASIMKRNEKAWQIEEQPKPKWNYTHGLVTMAFLKLWESSGKMEYYQYAKGYADDLINEKGEILRYNIEDFNIDNINAGKILFPLLRETQDPRYKKAMDTLKYQLEWQPRNTRGGFWHKLRYPWQVWLDGLYMGAPFYAQYAQEFDLPEAFDDIALQFNLIDTVAKDSATGLLYHGWDESKIQRWADPQTGCSPHFWGRALGWYAMALVDVLDFFPEDHPQRNALLQHLQSLSNAVLRYQDEPTGLWYQVMDQGDRQGNYLEASASCMFAYAYLKGSRMGYLEDAFLEAGKKAFDGIIEHLIEVAEGGEVHLHKCCAVAGLGGNPYRDGSYDYYVNELIRSNDPKGTGPFILAALEMEMINNQQR